MLRAAIAFFVLALVAWILGATGFAGISIEIGRTLLYVFLVLAVISFIANLLTGKKGIGSLALLILPALLLSCAENQRKETDRGLSTPTEASATAARQTGASMSTEVNFKQGSFALNETSRTALRSIVWQAKSAGTIDDLKVLSWADVEYPSASNPKAAKVKNGFENAGITSNEGKSIKGRASRAIVMAMLKDETK